MTSQELRDTIISLGPWHLDVQVTPEISTAVSLDVPEGTYPRELGRPAFSKPREGWLRRLDMIYPDGLDGRSFLDCACNCGGYSFWTKERGAGTCLGFDVRDHWIRQANFLKEQRTVAPADGISFEVMDLYDLANRAPRMFDITLFQGILYHLPDPVSGLKVAADRTRELIVVNTATASGHPDGCLVVSQEPIDKVMSGVYGLNWYPTGPDVVARALAWCGFPETRLMWWHQQTDATDEAGTQLGRLEILGARSPETFAAFDRARAEQARTAAAAV